MTLRQLVGKLGLAEVAKRLGIGVSTLRKWLSGNISKSGKTKSKTVISRYQIAKKAAKTRKKKKVVKIAASKKGWETRKKKSGFQERIASRRDIPVSQAPRSGPTTKRVKDLQVIGVKSLDTYRYVGEIHTVQVGKPLDDVDDAALAREAVSLWENSKSFRIFCRVVFLMFRFIPFDERQPWYRGELIPREGKWIDWWTSTKANGTTYSINLNIINVLHDARYNTIGNRIVWCEQMQVSLFDYREDITPPDIKDILNRRLS